MDLSRRALFRLLLITPLVRAMRPVPPLLLEAPVAGFRYHDGPACERSLHVGQPLLLRRERRNVHDTKAIAIHLPDGRKLGYVPRRLNEMPARLLDQQVTLVARIEEIRPAPAPPWERVSVAILLADGN